MSVQDMWTDLRRRWWWVVVGAVMLAGVGTFASRDAQPSYVSTVRLYVATEVEAGDPEKLFAQYQVTSARIASQMELVRSGLMRDAVSDRLYELGVAARPQGVVVTRPIDTVVIDVQVTAESPEDAQVAASAYGDVAPDILQEIESGTAPITVRVIDEAGPGAPVARGTLPNLVAGAALGGVLAAILAVGVGQLRRRAAAKPQTSSR